MQACGGSGVRRKFSNSLSASGQNTEPAKPALWLASLAGAFRRTPQHPVRSAGAAMSTNELTPKRRGPTVFIAATGTFALRGNA